MRDFAYIRATSANEAAALARHSGARFLAGGTTLVDLMKCGVEAPETLVDISRLADLARITLDGDGAQIGALAAMSDVATHPGIGAAFPAVAEALAQAASPQLRNMATIGGNLMQRTRCGYFRDPANFDACNKRTPDSGCAALGGLNRGHAVLGTSDRCIATYPGDLAVALVALDATIEIATGSGTRTMPVAGFFLPPGETPEIEHPTAPGDLITAIHIPASPAAQRSTYLKVRDRASYEFAAASAAVGLAVAEDGTVADVRVALGGVATIPWRARNVEAALTGRRFSLDAIAAASRLSADGAVDHGHNGFKIPLIRRTVARALMAAGGIA
jgi:xanthine dehydrogenase YagS FAD-binding subunit